MLMSLAGKDIAVQFMGDTSPIQIVLEHIGTGLCNHDPPNLVPFSGEGQPCQILLELHIPHTQITDFLRPCPLAYIRFKIIWFRRPMSVEVSGSRSRRATSSIVKIVRGLDWVRLAGIFCMLFIKTEAASKSRNRP